MFKQVLHSVKNFIIKQSRKNNLVLSDMYYNQVHITLSKKKKTKLPKPGLLYAVKQAQDKIRFDHNLLDNQT